HADERGLRAPAEEREQRIALADDAAAVFRDPAAQLRTGRDRPLPVDPGRSGSHERRACLALQSDERFSVSFEIRFTDTRHVLAAILTIGNEVVSGDTENTNASWLGRRLEQLGVQVAIS